YAGVNPTEGVEKFKEHSRDRYLSPADAQKLAAALDQLNHADLSHFVRLSLFTGARRSDVLSMRWDQITDGAKPEWRIPDPKNRTPYVVPLTSEAITVLAQRPQIKDNPWVFPSWGRSGHLMDLKKVWHEALKLAGLQNLRIHDLRRTQGSWLAQQ